MKSVQLSPTVFHCSFTLRKLLCLYKVGERAVSLCSVSYVEGTGSHRMNNTLANGAAPSEGRIWVELKLYGHTGAAYGCGGHRSSIGRTDGGAAIVAVTRPLRSHQAKLSIGQ